MQTELDSFLIEISALIFGKADDKEGKDGWLLDQILDKTGMKGTGAVHKGRFESCKPSFGCGTQWALRNLQAQLWVLKPSLGSVCCSVCSACLACPCSWQGGATSPGPELVRIASYILCFPYRGGLPGPQCSGSLQFTSSSCPG